MLILRCMLRGDAVDNAANLLVNWGWPCQRDSRTYECLLELTMLLARNQYARSEIVRTALGGSIGRNGDTVDKVSQSGRAMKYREPHASQR